MVTCSPELHPLQMYFKNILIWMIAVGRNRSNHPRCSVRKGVIRNFWKLTGKHLRQSLFFNKIAGLRPVTLLKKRLWHRCFLVNVAKFLRTPLGDCFWRKKQSSVCHNKKLTSVLIVCLVPWSNLRLKKTRCKTFAADLAILTVPAKKFWYHREKKAHTSKTEWRQVWENSFFIK